MIDNILITGGHGYIGSRINGGRILEGDITDHDSVYMQSLGMTGIVHLAAKGTDLGCMLDIKKAVESNIVGVQHVLNIALERKIWVLFISTYQIRDRSFYGLSKLMGEELCRIYQERGLQVSVLRLPIVYGPNDNENKVVTKFIEQLKRGVDPEIHTDDFFYFAYIDDVIDKIEKEVIVLEHDSGKEYSLYDLKKGIKECLKITQ